MTGFCDLHTHSYYSDGTAAPAEILAQAVDMELSAAALTDHNTVAGLPEFLQAAKGKEILAIPGVEISTGYNGREVHIVGLFLKPEVWDQVTEFVSIINIRKEESNRQLAAALKRLGYALDLDAMKAKYKGNINRAVFAAEMVEKGYLAEIKDGFKGVLSAKHGVYVPPERIPACTAIDFLRSVGAVPVAAHPFLNIPLEGMGDFLIHAKACGLAAMETHYSTYSSETTEAAVAMAHKYGLLESGGSDYHGANKPDIAIGTGRGDLQVPGSFVDRLKNV